LRFTLPVPVTLKRFLALEWVFIFGIVKKRIFKNGAQRYNAVLEQPNFFENNLLYREKIKTCLPKIK
jgi:hypothetical protein